MKREDALRALADLRKRLQDEFTRRHSHIPWPKIRGMRHVVVHRYFGVGLSIVRQTIENDIPQLRRPLEVIAQGS